MLRRSARTAAIVLAAAACGGDGLDPARSELNGRYALAAAEGAPLPLVLWTESSGASAALLADTLAFTPDGRVTRTRVLRHTDARGTVATETAAFTVEYRRRAHSIEIGRFTPCPINAICVGNDVGTLFPPVLHLRSSMYTIRNRPGLLRYVAARSR